MAHNPEEYGRLRREFIEAAAKYEPAGYQTFIQRTARSEEDYIRRGRHDCVACIKWPYKPWRECTILAPDSGTNAKPFFTMKTLFSKAWLWLPRVIAEGIVDTAEKHLSPPAELGLYWARSHHQLWGWLLWFDWLWRCGEVETEEPEFPPAGMDLRPFSSSADLIARWGLDGSAGTVPVWLAELVFERKRAGTGSDVGHPGGVTSEPAGPAAKASEAAAIEAGAGIEQPVTTTLKPDESRYLDITLGDREACRILDGREYEIDFGNKAKPWDLLKVLIEAGEDGIHRRELVDLIGGSLDKHKAKLLELIEPLKLDIDLSNGIWTLKSM